MNSIFLEILENWLSYNNNNNIYVPYLQVGWSAPAPLTSLIIKAVYIVFTLLIGCVTFCSRLYNLHAFLSIVGRRGAWGGGGVIPLPRRSIFTLYT